MKQLLLALPLCCMYVPGHSQDGLPDLMFGSDSYVITDFDGQEDQYRAIVGTADGGAVAGGFSSFDNTFWQFTFAKYLEDGLLDPAFGNGGKFDFGFPGMVNEYLSDLHLRPDGRLLACGSTNNTMDFISRIGLVQLNPDGSLDNSFGTNGHVMLLHPDSLSMQVPSMVLQPDGSAVVCGLIGIGPQEVLVARVDANGALDPTFGNGGYVRFLPMANGGFAWDIALLPNGNLALAGMARDANVDQHTLVVMLQPEGQLDPSFGNGGILLENFGDQEQYYAVKVHNGTHLLCAGFVEVNGMRDGVVRRYDLNGDLDQTFGTNGTVLLDYLGFKDDAFDLQVQPDGKILVATEGEDATELDDFICVRLLPDGSPDPTFGVNGWAVEATPEDEDVYTVRLDVNGKILLAGTYDDDASPTGLDGLVQRLSSGLNIGLEEVAALAVSEPYPNPARDQARITFVLQDAQTIHMDLVDASGRQVWRSSETRSYAAGRHSEVLQFPAGLPSGTYLLNIRSEQGALTKTIEVVR